MKDQKVQPNSAAPQQGGATSWQFRLLAISRGMAVLAIVANVVGLV